MYATDHGALLDGRYRIGPVLARGGMSTVHRGTDTRLDRPVAIKIMESRLAADPVFRTRFEREARSAARIDHPAVVDVHDQGTAMHEGEPVAFLVMELVEGGTLRDVLQARGPLGAAEALAVMEPVLAGLAEAHRRGLVHRDVKPENVLISRDGEVKVADFGLVTAAAQAGASHSGTILGTVAYLSPEQVATGAADARSDVYAAGIVLYELLTGAPPYSGDTAISVAYRHVHDDVPAPSAAAADVPPELDELVGRATRRDPEARPADAAAFAAALRRVADRLGLPAVRPPVPPARPVEEQETLPAEPRRVAGDLPPAVTQVTGPGGTRTLERPPEAAVPAGPARLAARPRRRPLVVAGVAVVAVLGLLAAVAGWWFTSGRWTAVPSLAGVERAAAERLLVDADLVAQVAEAYDDDVPAGVVTATDPEPASRLLRGTPVRVTVSTGRPVVPAIGAGTDVAAAEQAVRAAGLTPVRPRSAAVYSATVATGTVVRTDPAAGSALPVGGEVTLVVSRGAEPAPEPDDPVRVPSVVGDELDDAEDTLEDAGLEVEVRSGFPFDDDRDEDRDRDRDRRVIAQRPAPGSVVEEGSTVVLQTF